MQTKDSEEDSDVPAKFMSTLSEDQQENIMNAESDGPIAPV